MRLCYTFLMVFALAACRDQSTDSPARTQAQRGAGLGQDRAELAPAGGSLRAPPAPPPPGGALLPLRRETIESELASGAGCSLDDQPGGPLMVAVAGDAIVNHEGRIVHLEPAARDLNALMLGGRFVGDGLVVVIEREHELERAGEVTSWQATLRLERGRHALVSFHHVWSCGA